MKTGRIRIIDGILKFEYYKLKKPEEPECFNSNSGLRSSQTQEVIYNSQLDKYEASKRTIEVINYYDLHEKVIRIVDARCQFENNQPCKAEVNGKATIIELL